MPPIGRARKPTPKVATDDVDAFLASMGDAADVALGPLGFENFLPGWRTAWLRDPDGVIVEISQGFTDESTETTEIEEPA
jgi:glyoxylase I family protein